MVKNLENVAEKKSGITIPKTLSQKIADVKIHPLANIFPMLSIGQLADLAEDIKKKGLREPILIDDQNRVIDGRNRLAACEIAGIEPVFNFWNNDFDGDEFDLIVSLNLHRRHLNESQRALVAAQISTYKDSGKIITQQNAAKLLNVSERSVRRAKRASEQGDEVVEKIKRGERTVSGALKSDNVLLSSKSVEWYTPPQYIDAVKNVFGGEIDLDPASCKEANKIVGATKIYTKKDDGFSKDWSGFVFCNPPYGRNENGKSNQDLWSKKMIEQWENGNIDGGILLVNAAVGDEWFYNLWEYPICFPKKRIKFIDVYGKSDQPTHGNAFVYFGSTPATFKYEFKEFGRVVMPDD